jgi:hypothetical protein
VGSKGGGDHGTAQIKCDDGTCNLSKDVNVDNLRLGLSKKTAPSEEDKAVTLTCKNNSKIEGDKIYVRILDDTISIDFDFKDTAKRKETFDKTGLTNELTIGNFKSFKINEL